MKCDESIRLNEEILLSRYFTKEVAKIQSVSVSTNDQIEGLVYMDMRFAGLIMEKQIKGSSAKILNLVHIWMLLNYGTKHPLREDFFKGLSFKVIV